MIALKILDHVPIISIDRSDVRNALPTGAWQALGDVARQEQRVGRAQAARLLFTAVSIDSAEALRIGLVDMIGDVTKVIDDRAQ